MTRKEEQFFKALIKDREENAKTLEKPSMRGTKRNVVEKYSDQAHFIYELLQNADDAGATRATFLLSHNELFFKHNGTRKFSISDPANEDADSDNGTLGDINAITSIGNSNKRNKIGKFGVGFKAVFQYTSSPAIFEKHISFRIKNFISLEPLNFDHPERKRGETLFEFPFDKEDCPPVKAFEDIATKLSMLDCPILFLSHLQKIKFQLGDKVGSYEKEIKSSQTFGDISAELLSLIKVSDKKREKRTLWLFSRKSDGRNYSVGYFLDDKNRLYPVDKPAFCFFPTKRNTKLKFIIHAPFLLTDSREGILAGNDHNLKMIELLASLASDSLTCLRDLKLIDDSILRIIPIREKDFANADEISFKPIFKAVKEKMLTAEILPTCDDYISAKNAYWAVAPHLTDILSDEQLGALVYNSDAKWIFIKINRNTADLDVRDYFSEIKSFTEDKMFDIIDENFIEAQSLEWLHKFYKWLSERSQKRITDAKVKPFFLDANRKATAAFDMNNKPLIFMPTESNIGDYPTICVELLENLETKKFLKERIMIDEPKLKDMIANKILPLYKTNSVTETNEADYFKIVFTYYDKQCHNNEIGTYIDELKQVIYLRSLSKKFVKPHDNMYRYGFEKLYMPETEFIEYFTIKTPECFLDKSFYLNLVGTDEKNRLVEFFKKLGVAEEIRYLYNKVIPLYKSDFMTDDENHFKIIFHYYQRLTSWEKDNYIKNLKRNIRLRRRDKKFVEPKDLYMPLPELVEYFTAANRAPFIDKDFYLNLVNNENLLLEFFKELGVAEEVRYLPIEIQERQAYKYSLDFPENYNSERGIIWREAIIDSSVEIVKDIAENKNADKSFVLWRRMVAVNSVGKLRDNIKGICKYHYYSSKTLSYEPVKIKVLRETAWLVDVNGNFKTPSEITVDDMAKDYDVTSENALEVIEFFNIAKNNRLTADERHDLAFMKRLKEKYSDSELEKLIADKNNSSSTLRNFDDNTYTEENNDSESNTQSSQKFNDTTTSRNSTNDLQSPKNFDDIDIDEHTDSEDNSYKRQNLVEKKTHTSKELVPSQPKPKSTILDYVEPDADDLTPVAINYSQKLAQAKAKSDAEQAEIEHLEELQQKALSAEKYSFAWFKAILELEIFNSNEKNSNNKEISISFGRVEFDEGTQRTLILKYPSRYIPQFVEELENIPLVLQTIKTTKTVEIEVAAVRNYTLSVKLKKTQKLDDINLNDVVEATITAKNPVFLLEKLQEQFSELGFNDNYNLRENLCENIEFVFGPPGTGKTYNLAQKIIALMSERANKKILVLTPTNKAADVIVNKIIELDTDKTYKNWLLRFGTTNDPNIEKDGVFQDKTFDIHSKRKNVTVTTIARFPYDFFITNGIGNLRDIDWDYIIIDEASMIMLVQIILPLYKKTPKKFIIAGDPFQIQPVTEIDLWKNENIYTLVGLNSFDNPKTSPHDYSVETLKTQYRSVPAIGNIFSNFAYKGILSNARTDSEQLLLNIEDWLEVQTLNIIRFPVSKYESIYRSRRLGGTSSYHIYSALFTFEFVRALSRRIDKKISIGVIAPYRAQADLIEKLFASAKLNIPTGTVHTFQGDECDILIAVFNAPPNISSSPEMFLNRLNIVNVAISRARNYLFIVMPDNSTDRIENLRLIKYVENLFAKEGYGEFAAQDIENLIFGSSNYLEENSFITGHQSVNVYGKLERKYEIRSEDNAVDVQLHET